MTELAVPAPKSGARGEPGAPAARRLRPIAAWLFGCCALIFAMIVLGGLTRLTLSGLSITDWQPILGIIPPSSHAEWLAAFAQFRAIPEYRFDHFGMTLGAFKVIYFWEYAHRLLGRLIGFAYALPFAYFLFRGRMPARLRWPLGFILLLGAGQGLLGWYMVKSGLAGRPEVSQYRLVAHLGLALIIYCAILWVGLSIVRVPAREEAASRFWRWGADGATLVVFLTILAGGFVAGLHAGLIDNTFPLMGGRFIPQGYGALHPFIRNPFANPVAAQFDHRLVAAVTVAAILALWLKGLFTPLSHRVRCALHALAAAIVVQAALGLATLLLVVPIPLAALHQAGAVVVLTAAIVLRHTLGAPASRYIPAEMDASLPAAL
jgi:heme a synthase